MIHAWVWRAARDPYALRDNVFASSAGRTAGLKAGRPAGL
jgi:hypothetical protein